MKFKKNNGIKCYFDFQRYYEHIPDGVDFQVETHEEDFCLTACGYGCLQRHTKECYGDGGLYVPKSSLTKRRIEIMAEVSDA